MNPFIAAMANPALAAMAANPAFAAMAANPAFAAMSANPAFAAMSANPALAATAANPAFAAMSPDALTQSWQQMLSAMHLPGPAANPAMPEVGWWWLPSVKLELWQAAASRWFAPTLDTSALAANDRRFRAESWGQQPFFQSLRDQYLRVAGYWRELLAGAALDERERHRAHFFLEQWLDAIAPTNFFATNPEAIEKALATHGESLKHGIENLVQDIERGHIAMTDESAFTVGINVATSKGEVVFRNDLIEIIHYTPTQKAVHQRPLLIVPPCINKFYILDLKPENSFVGHAVAQGFDVYLMSWRNIPEALQTLTWEDYLNDGVLTAIDEVRDHASVETINTLGFCVGGTILACALAVLAARGELDEFVESATYLTTLLDFSEPGDIKAFLGESTYQMRVQQLGEDGSKGRMSGAELAQAFASLRANDLIWSFVVKNYLKGEDPPAFDLLYWNGDSTNLPGPMYLYYLRNFYLDNKLIEAGALTMLDEPIDLSLVTIDSFVYSSREDHIVPWKSAFASAEIWGGDVEFVLGASGHIAGVVNPPVPQKRSYWTNAFPANSPEAWDASAKEHAGSWWPHWYAWLAKRSGKKIAPRKHKGSKLGTAPGSYVLEKM
jgi:polyhydroxyalkanoate synthase subunit PhaC